MPLCAAAVKQSALCLSNPDMALNLIQHFASKERAPRKFSASISSFQFHLSSGAAGAFSNHVLLPPTSLGLRIFNRIYFLTVLGGYS